MATYRECEPVASFSTLTLQTDRAAAVAGIGAGAGAGAGAAAMLRHCRCAQARLPFALTCSNSQGFCCKCDLFNFGTNTELTRGNLQCGLISLKKSAHCLRHDDAWWFYVSGIREWAVQTVRSY